jgi:hypothetical protein
LSPDNGVNSVGPPGCIKNAITFLLEEWKGH